MHVSVLLSFEYPALYAGVRVYNFPAEMNILIYFSTFSSVAAVLVLQVL